jgi:hypothetical protein
VRKVLLDENLPHALEAALPEFEVWTVGRAGWGGIKNGELLRRASGEFAVFVTADRGIPHQQNLKSFPLGFVLIAVRGTKIEDILPHITALREALAAVGPGELVVVAPE